MSQIIIEICKFLHAADFINKHLNLGNWVKNLMLTVVFSSKLIFVINYIQFALKFCWKIWLVGTW
jgi:hypothetical protein